MVETLQQPKAMYFSVTHHYYINKLFLVQNFLNTFCTPITFCSVHEDMEEKKNPYTLLIPETFYTEMYVSSQSSFL